VLPRLGILDDEVTTGLRRLRQGVRRPPGDEAVRPLPGGASTHYATSATYSAQVIYHLPVLIIFRYSKGMPVATSFVDKLQPYVAEWASAAHE
jgi:hypothetical protein